MAGGNVTEQRDLGAELLVQGIFGTADDDIGLDADSLELLDTCLGGLCFQLAGSL